MGWGNGGFGVGPILGMVLLMGIAMIFLGSYADIKPLGITACAEQGLEYQSYEYNYIDNFDSSKGAELTIICKDEPEVLHKNTITIVKANGGK